MNSVVRPRPQARADCDGVALPRIARHAGSRYALAWLPILVLAPIVSALQRADLAQVLMLLLLAALHAAVTVLRARTAPGRSTELLVVGAVLGVIGYQVLWSEHQIFLYPLMALAAAVGLRRRLAMGVVGGLAVSGAVAAGLTSGSLVEVMSFGIVTYMAGASAFLIDALSAAVAQLRQAEDRLARTAVVEERERFARDLHDLLGHTLSLIVVKAEAVRRFLPADPTTAAEHARGIEEIGRSALGEVREAVVGYRETTLADELDAAREALAGAGLSVEISSDAADLPQPVDRLFAWVVREGITNILRHSRAARCWILVECHDGEATVEITDDGGAGAARTTGRAPATGAELWRDRAGAERAGSDGAWSPSGPARQGSDHDSGWGLAGLRERAETLGGVLAADQDETGFRLGVSVPTDDGGAP